MSIYQNVNGAVKEITKVYQNINGTVKEVTSGYQNVNGTVKQIYTAHEQQYITIQQQDLDSYHTITTGDTLTLTQSGTVSSESTQFCTELIFCLPFGYTITYTYNQLSVTVNSYAGFEIRGQVGYAANAITSGWSDLTGTLDPNYPNDYYTGSYTCTRSAGVYIQMKASYGTRSLTPPYPATVIVSAVDTEGYPVQFLPM